MASGDVVLQTTNGLAVTRNVAGKGPDWGVSRDSLGWLVRLESGELTFQSVSGSLVLEGVTFASSTQTTSPFDSTKSYDITITEH
jgi:hypothetical protein